MKKKKRARSPEMKEKQLERILRKGKELFLRHGIEGFSLRELAKQLDMAPSNLYNYFSNKRELWFGIVMREFKALKEILQEIVSQHEQVSKDAFRQAMHAYLQFGIENPAEYRIMFVTFVPSASRTGPIEEKHEPKSLLILRELVQRGIETGLFKKKYRTKDIDFLVFYIWSVLHGAVLVAQSIFADSSPRRPSVPPRPAFFDFVVEELVDHLLK